jgi:hypothetical protein
MEYNQDGLNTRFVDEAGNEIFVGDILMSIDSYCVMVCQDEGGHFYGSLICEIGNSCRNIPYALNEGHDYYKVFLP